MKQHIDIVERISKLNEIELQMKESSQQDAQTMLQSSIHLETLLKVKRIILIHKGLII